MLYKFYIRDAKTPRNAPFTFHEDGFYRTFKRAAYEEIKKIPKNASKTADRITDGMFLSLLCTTSLASWSTDNWMANFWYIFASFNLAFLTVTCHNYILRRPNWRIYLVNMSMWSYGCQPTHLISIIPKKLSGIRTTTQCMKIIKLDCCFFIYGLLL